MANSIKDNNGINTMIGVLNTDGSTVTLVKADPTSHILDAVNGSSGSDFGEDNAKKDDNNVSTLLAVSSDDGSTPVPLYVNSSGQILIKST